MAKHPLVEQCAWTTVVQSLATKFIEEPTTKDRAEAEIASHNERLNKDGQYLLSESTLTLYSNT